MLRSFLIWVGIGFSFVFRMYERWFRRKGGRRLVFVLLWRLFFSCCLIELLVEICLGVFVGFLFV